MTPSSPRRDLGLPPGRPRAAITIGKFDGVHAGHRHLAAQLIEAADDRAVQAVAVVLHPDPASVLTGRSVPTLTTVDERAARLRRFGIDTIWHIPFDQDLAALTPDAFWDLLAEQLDVRAVVVGPDFVFGHDRAGDVTTLARLGAARQFDLRVVAPLTIDGEQISSRGIRTLIESGDVTAAATRLRAAPRLAGDVVHGAQRGRELGFPTANLALTADFAVPANGVYAVRASWTWPDGRGPGGSGDGLASVGVRPTFDNGARIVEVYLLDFDGDLYDSVMTVDFVARQRGEERFPSAGALVEQMRRDEVEARRRLAELDQPAWAWHNPDTLVARGGDMAALCTNLAAGCVADIDSAAAGAGEARSTGRRQQLDLPLPHSQEPEHDLRRWLDFLSSPRGGSIDAADVYHLSDGHLNALVARGDAGSTDPLDGRAWDAVSVRRRPSGQLVATARRRAA